MGEVAAEEDAKRRLTETIETLKRERQQKTVEQIGTKRRLDEVTERLSQGAAPC